MSIVVGPAFAAPLSIPRPPRWLAPALALVISLAAGMTLVRPALAQADFLAVASVSVAVEGAITTAGLPAHSAVSTLAVHNTGAAPIVWSPRPVVTGPTPGSVVVQAWEPTNGSCTEPASAPTKIGWSSPLAAGAEATRCIRISATQAAVGPVHTDVTVAAQAA